MIRCGKPRWDAKDTICKKKTTDDVEIVSKKTTEPKPDPVLTKKDTEDALAKLLADRAKLDNFWSQK